MPPMPTRRATPTALALALALAALLAVSAPALGKEGMEASLDAPIGMGTPEGTVLTIGITVTMLGDPTQPIDGSPIYLRLLGRDGASTREAASGTRTPGYYTVRIAVPEGGARGVEIGLHGTYDLPILVTGEKLVFGGITPRTAQAVSLDAAEAPVVPASPAPAVDSAPMAPAPVPAPVVAGPPWIAPLAGGVAIVVAAAASVAFLVARRTSGAGAARRKGAGGHG